MAKARLLLAIAFMFLVVSGANALAVSANETAMVKDLMGDVWLISGQKGEKVEVSQMQELKAGDKIEVGKGAGVTVLYYYSEIEEKYLENSVVEIGEEKGTVHKGEAKSVDDASGSGYIRIDSDLPVSASSQEDFGAFTLRGNPPPIPSKYFEDANIQRYAVIIGISEFKDPKIPALKYADRDAQSFYDYLISPNGGSFKSENVLLLKNKDATLKNVKDAFTNYLKQAVDDDFVVVYIASHGEPEPDRPKNLYLLTHDSELERLASTSYHMENVNMDMKRYISAQRLIFFADACHAGGIAQGGFSTRGFSNSINSALSALSTTKEGWAMITASRSSEVSLESDKWGNGHGAFTYFLLEGLNGKADIAGNYNGIVTIAEAFDYLENRVKRETKNAQHPVITGDFDNNLPIGFLPVVVNNDKKAGSEKGKVPVELKGSLSLNSTEEGGNIFLNGKFVGKTCSDEPLVKELSPGAVKVNVKKKGLPDYNKLVYVNPNETSNVYIAMRSAGSDKQSVVKYQPQKSGVKAAEQKTYVAPKIDESKLKDSIDGLIKELEEMRLKQMAAQGGAAQKPPVALEKKPVRIAQPTGVPISIKRFTANMHTLSSQKNLDILRMRVVDELIKESKISIVERDLQHQEDILREQRMGGSILADELYRVEIGRILGADFICFSRVFQSYDSDDIILSMEIVETATTLVDTIECSFKSDDSSLANAKSIAAKIRERISSKRKL